MATGERLAQPQHGRALATCTSKAAFEAVGLWTAGDDGSDINGVARSCPRAPPHPAAADEGGAGAPVALIAAAADGGDVRLAAAPCVMRSATVERHVAHASHVAAVCFACNGGRLFSAGGADGTVMQWRVAPPAPAADASATVCAHTATAAPTRLLPALPPGVSADDVSAVQQQVQRMQAQLDAELARLARPARYARALYRPSRRAWRCLNAPCDASSLCPLALRVQQANATAHAGAQSRLWRRRRARPVAGQSAAAASL